MRPWRLTLEIDDSRQPLYLRIARAVIEDVRRGRLSPGTALPGSRALAEDLAVHRNTVKAAYAELIAQGWIVTRPSSGTFVSPSLPEPLRAPRKRRPDGAKDRVGFPLCALDLPAADTWSESADTEIVFSGLDAKLLPHAALARAYRRALASTSGLLGYRIGRGHPRLVAALQTMLVARGMVPGRPLVVTRGSQMALYLVARALLQPGDAVAVEDPGYAFSWPALRLLGIEIVPIPVDRGGLRVDRLGVAVRERRIRAVLLTPHAQYPTGVTLSAPRRLELLALAARHELIVIEDDFVHEVRLDGRPILPLASADRTGNVIYLGSFSKTFAPSIRLGFVAGPEPVIERVARIRARIDVCGDAVTELAVAELLEDGEIQRHVRRVTRTYRRRRDALVRELRGRLGGRVCFDPAAAWSALWVNVDASIDVEEWARAALARGVGFLTGRHFFFDEAPRPYLWLGFAGLDEGRIEIGVARMAQALADLPGKRLSRRPPVRRSSR